MLDFPAIKDASCRAWDSARKEGKVIQDNFVLLGAGALGRVVAERLLRAGIVPRCVCDNDPSKWGQTLQGLPILSFDDAARRYPGALFVTTIYTRSFVESQLRSAQVAFVSFHRFAMMFPETLLPWGYFSDPSELFQSESPIREGARLWSDRRSDEEYVDQIVHRFTGKDLRSSFRPKEETYFDRDVLDLDDKEVFVNCGAYDGDTVRAFLERKDHRFDKIVAIEPDSTNANALEGWRNSLEKGERDRIALIRGAVQESNADLSFRTESDKSSRLTRGSDSNSIVRGVSLDQITARDTVTFINMDIEGAELSALRGARSLIQRCRPKLAICLYHRSDDLWKIPLLLKSFVPEYRLYLRRYSDDGWELVLYALPPDSSAGEGPL